ncbi:hypothetical protein ACFXTN_031767 [Malus domestica]
MAVAQISASLSLSIRAASGISSAAGPARLPHLIPVELGRPLLLVLLSLLKEHTNKGMLHVNRCQFP